MDDPRDSVVVASRARTQPLRRDAAATPVIPPDRSTDPADLKNPALYINRELSWLEFNERVLAQARDASHPLLERVKFLAITGTNLDEFFMIRVATTLKKLREDIDDVAADGYNTEQQLDAMRARARKMLADQAATWADLRRQLEAEQIFADIREELVALQRVLTPAEVVACVPRPQTLAAVVARLQELLRGVWSRDWVKAKNAKRRPQGKKAKGAGAHTSVHKVLQTHRQQREKANGPSG